MYYSKDYVSLVIMWESSYRSIAKEGCDRDTLSNVVGVRRLLSDRVNVGRHLRGADRGVGRGGQGQERSNRCKAHVEELFGVFL